ncbi:hypothetical protein ACWGQ5_38860 [Streptomyces sp. NPDC055722]
MAAQQTARATERRATPTRAWRPRSPRCAAVNCSALRNSARLGGRPGHLGRQDQPTRDTWYGGGDAGYLDYVSHEH